MPVIERGAVGSLLVVGLRTPLVSRWHPVSDSARLAHA